MRTRSADLFVYLTMLQRVCNSSGAAFLRLEIMARDVQTECVASLSDLDLLRDWLVYVDSGKASIVQTRSDGICPGIIMWVTSIIATRHQIAEFGIIL